MFFNFDLGLEILFIEDFFKGLMMFIGESEGFIGLM